MLDFIRKQRAPVMDHQPQAPAESPEEAITPTPVDFSRFNKVINFCLYALVLVVPFLFTSLTSEVRDFNKLNLIFFGVVIMLAVWLIKVLTTRSVSWVKTSLDYVMLGFLLVYFLSSMLSIDKVSSFLGYYGRFTGSFISVLSFVLLYFLVVNNLKRERVGRLLNFLTIGSGLVLVYSFLQLLGVYLLPMIYTHDRSFNPIGSLVGLSLFAALCVVFMQSALRNAKRSKTLVLWLLTLIALTIMLFVNAFVAWLVLALTMVGFLAISMALEGAGRESKEHSTTGFWQPLLILVIAVLFVAFQFLPSSVNPRNLITVNLPSEVQLSNATTWTLVGNSISGSPKSALLGSGPGTTGIAFGQIKPAELNKTIVWSLTFDRASSEIANIAIENGILGLVAFELLNILFLIYGIFFLLKKSTHAGWQYAFGFFMTWLALYIVHFFYFFNTTFYFIFWLSLGGFMAMAYTRATSEEHAASRFATSPRSALSWMFVSLLLLAGILIGASFEAAVYGGELVYASAIKAVRADKPDLAAVSKQFARAVNLNPYRDVYYLTYGQSLILLAQQETAKEKPDKSVIQQLMGGLIQAGLAAVNISPAKSSNWQALSQFYADIKPLAADADTYVISSLKSAIEHDPKSPALHYQLGQAYFAASVVPDTSRPANPDGSVPAKRDDSMMTNSIAELNKAIELKNDLPEFYIQLARVLEANSQLTEAKQKMDTAAGLFPTNPDVLFEDGRLAYNQKNLDEAQKTFGNVVSLSPDYANAHYSLGLIAQQKGDKARALSEFEKTRDILVTNKQDTTNIDKVIESVK